MKKLFPLFMILISYNSYCQSRITNITKSDTFYVQKIKKYKKIGLIYAKNNLNETFKIVYKHPSSGQNVKKNMKYFLEISTVAFEIDGKIVRYVPNRITCLEYGKRLKICTEPQNEIYEIYDLIKAQPL